MQPPMTMIAMRAQSSMLASVAGADVRRCYVGACPADSGIAVVGHPWRPRSRSHAETCAGANACPSVVGILDQ